MKKILIATILAMLFTIYAVANITIEQLQGAWWSDFHNPTADFSINGNEVWLDFDAQYHPCKIEGDLLIFDLAEGGLVMNKIISIDGDRLVLETPEGKNRLVLNRVKEKP